MKPKKNILIVENNELVVANLKKYLPNNLFNFIEVTSEKNFLKIYKNTKLDLILIDIDLIMFLKSINNSILKSPIILIIDFDSIPFALELIKSGINNFLVKPLVEEEVIFKVNNAFQKRKVKLNISNNILKKSYFENSNYIQIIYKSEVMDNLMKRLTKIASSNLDNILITGETGTGKELIAKWLHKMTNKANKPFISVNCTAIPATLLESELFGYNEGAFTNATRSKPGLIEEANGGILFLDEIGDMDLALQSKLLRFLEERKIRRLGARKEINIKITVIAATNKDFNKTESFNNFRRDLFYRLGQVKVNLPSLRERIEDIPWLSYYFVYKFCKKHGKRIFSFTESAIKLLMKYNWPGNIRELRNLLEEIVIFEDNLERINGDIVLKYLKEFNFENNNLPNFDEISNILFNLMMQNDLSIDDLLNNINRNIILKVLKITNNNKVKTAKILKIDRSTLNYRSKLLKIF